VHTKDFVVILAQKNTDIQFHNEFAENLFSSSRDTGSTTTKLNKILF